MLEALSGNGIMRTLLIMGVCATTGAVTGDLDTHTPCKFISTQPPRCQLIPGVHIEVVYGTRGCLGVTDTCDYRLELIYVPTAGMPGAIERHEVNLRRVGSHPRHVLVTTLGTPYTDLC